jgi:hypothetical protein
MSVRGIPGPKCGTWGTRRSQTGRSLARWGDCGLRITGGLCALPPMRRKRAWMGHGLRRTPLRFVVSQVPNAGPGAPGRVRRAGNWRGVDCGLRITGMGLCSPTHAQKTRMDGARAQDDTMSVRGIPGPKCGTWGTRRSQTGRSLARWGDCGLRITGWVCALPPMRRKRAWMGHGLRMTPLRFVVSQVPNAGPRAPGTGHASGCRLCSRG